MENAKRGGELRSDGYLHFESDPNELHNRIAPSVSAYNSELIELRSRLRHCTVQERGSLPKFNKRHLGQLIGRIQKIFETAKNKMKRSGGSIQELLTDMLVSPGYALAYVAYVETLHEMRNLLKEVSEIEGDIKWLYSPRLGCERALIPLQFLTSLKWRLRRILLEDDVKKREMAEHNLDLITGVLDRCYEVLSSLHSARYVGDLDKILDLNSKLFTLHDQRHVKERDCDPRESFKDVTSDSLALRTDCSVLSLLSNDLFERSFDKSNHSIHPERAITSVL